MTTDDAKSYLSKREIPRLFESLMTGLMYHRPSDHIQYLIDCLHKVNDKGQENISWSSFVDIRRTKTPLPPINNNDKKRPSSKGSSRPTSRTKTPKGEEILTLDMGNLEASLINRMMSPTLSERSITPLGERVTSPLVRDNRVLSPDNAVSVSRPQQGASNAPLPEEPTKQDFRTDTPPLPAIQKDKVALPDVPVVLVMGAPGSGKEKHLEALVARYPDWKHLNMGTLIKEEISDRGEAHTKWKLTKDLISRGEPAQEEVTIDVLLAALKGCKSAKGIIVTGFPRNMSQVGDFQKQIGRVDAAFMIDCDESIATERLLRRGKSSNRPEDTMAAIANRLNYFKANSLEAAKHYDDQGKLVVIDGNQADNTVTYDVGKAFDDMFYGKHGGTKPVGDAPKAENVPEAALYKGKYEREDTEVEEEKDVPLFPAGDVPQPPTISTEDTGRKPGLPTCPIIFVAGGPGSGKGTQCSRILERYPGFVHLSMGDIIRTEISTKGSVDEKWGMIATIVSKGEMAPEEEAVHLLKQELNKHSSAKAFVVEGFPRDKGQVEAFNKEIGGLNFVMLFDCEEYYMQTRLMKRGKDSGRIDDNLTAIANRINFYKYNTLPVMRYFENIGKLVVRDIKDLDGDKDVEEMFFDISQLFDFAFFGKPQEDKDKRSGRGSQDEAATRIQACFHGYQTRSQFVKSQMEVKSVPEAEDKKNSQAKKASSKAYVTQSTPTMTDKEMAVHTLGAGFKGLKFKQNDKKDSKSNKPSNKPSNKAITKTAQIDKQPDKAQAKQTIQSAFLAFKNHGLKKKDKPKEKKDSKAKDTSNKLSEDDAKQRLAAGFQGLKKMQTNKQKDKPTENIEDDAEMKDAALRIQAGFRGYKTRQEIQAIKADKDKAQNEKEPSQGEVVEETIAPTEATTTGENIDNPAHSQALDEAADS